MGPVHSIIHSCGIGTGHNHRTPPPPVHGSPVDTSYNTHSDKVTLIKFSVRIKVKGTIINRFKFLSIKMDD